MNWQRIIGTKYERQLSQIGKSLYHSLDIQAGHKVLQLSPVAGIQLSYLLQRKIVKAQYTIMFMEDAQLQKSVQKIIALKVCSRENLIQFLQTKGIYLAIWNNNYTFQLSESQRYDCVISNLGLLQYNSRILQVVKKLMKRDGLLAISLIGETNKMPKFIPTNEACDRHRRLLSEHGFSTLNEIKLTVIYSVFSSEALRQFYQALSNNTNYYQQQVGWQETRDSYLQIIKKYGKMSLQVRCLRLKLK